LICEYLEVSGISAADCDDQVGRFGLPRNSVSTSCFDDRVAGIAGLKKQRNRMDVEQAVRVRDTGLFEDLESVGKPAGGEHHTGVWIFGVQALEGCG